MTTTTQTTISDSLRSGA